jgi:hypothetical protein
MSATLAMNIGDRFSGAIPEASGSETDLVELALVLPRWQVDALAAAARGRGLTAGQALRRLIRGYCANQSGSDW